MFPLSALLAHAELRTRAKAADDGPSPADARRATRVTRYGNLTIFPRVERGVMAADDAARFAPGEAMSPEIIDAVWEEPRVVATISNVSPSGVGLILAEELPTGLEFDVNWDEGDRPGPVRFEVVHTKPLSAGLYRTGARLILGELPAEPVPTPFVRRFELTPDAPPAVPQAMVPAMVPVMASVMAPPAPTPAPTPAPAAAPMPAAAGADEPRFEPRPLSLVRDGVMSLTRVPAEPAGADRRASPPGTFDASAAAGFEKTERLDGVTVCGWERSIELRRDGGRMYIYIHSPGKKNGWGIYVDPDAFEAAVNRVQIAAGSPFVATTLAA